MQQQIDNLLIPIFGLLSVAIGHLFDVPPHILWVAAIGSAAGVAFSRETTVFGGFVLILGGTLATGWSIPVVLEFWPTIAQKSAAAGLSFGLIAFRRQIRESVPKLVSAAFERLSNIIRGNGP